MAEIAAGSTGCCCLCIIGLANLVKKKSPRSLPGVDLNKQSKGIPGSEEFVEGVDADGKRRQICKSEVRVCNIPFKEIPKGPVKDSNGLLTAIADDVQTLYDVVFGPGVADKSASSPAMSYCTKKHTFKDTVLPNGKPNPKPAVVDVPGTWQSLTYGEVTEKAKQFGSFLRQSRYMIEGQKVAIWAGNCPEWLIIDLACSVFNFASVSVYDTLGPDAASFIIADSSASAVCCEEKTFKRMPDLLADPTYRDNRAGDVRTVISLGAVDTATQTNLQGKGIAVTSFQEAIKSTVTLAKITPPKPSSMATLMYTSGTTGNPKGVMLSQNNIVATLTMARVHPSLAVDPSDQHLAYLPLAHILERVNCYGCMSMGCHVSFPSEGTKSLLADLGVIKPTFFAGVPKVYENIRDAVRRKMTGVKLKLFEAALAAKTRDFQTGCGYSPLWDKLVFAKAKQAVGGRVRFCITGGAPISKDTLYFVACCLAPPVQGFGCTETCSANTLCVVNDMSKGIGTVGAPAGSCMFRLIDVPDMNYFTAPAEKYTDPITRKAFEEGRAKPGGEVLIGGPAVALGYYDPAVNAQGRTISLPSNGMSKQSEKDFIKEMGLTWFITGDIGSWTPEGCLKIVDRKKNMFKTSLGEYVPVEEVEKIFIDNCAYVDFGYVPKETKVSYVGLCCVVSDSIGLVMKWAKEAKVAGTEKEVVESKAFKELLIQEFDKAAKEKKLQRFMWITKDHLHVEYHPIGYQEEWVQGVVCANGRKEQLLTATLKVRRAQLNEYFAPIFPKIYADRPADHILP